MFHVFHVGNKQQHIHIPRPAFNIWPIKHFEWKNCILDSKIFCTTFFYILWANCFLINTVYCTKQFYMKCTLYRRPRPGVDNSGWDWNWSYLCPSSSFSKLSSWKNPHWDSPFINYLIHLINFEPFCTIFNYFGLYQTNINKHVFKHFVNIICHLIHCKLAWW